MDADEFRDYILGFIFYKYLSEKMLIFANNELIEDGIKYDEIVEVSMANRIEPLLAINFEPLSQRKITYSVLISVDSFLLPA